MDNKLYIKKTKLNKNIKEEIINLKNKLSKIILSFLLILFTSINKVYAEDSIPTTNQNAVCGPTSGDTIKFNMFLGLCIIINVISFITSCSIIIKLFKNRIKSKNHKIASKENNLRTYILLLISLTLFIISLSIISIRYIVD